MKSAVYILIITSLAFVGCLNDAVSPDTTPPGAPTGLSTSTGDNLIELFWTQNRERDVAGYNVFVSSAYDGRYELIGSTREPYFLDREAANGNIYYYAVTAYDYDGNESALSRDVAYDIPRPEGYDVVVSDYRRNPERGGYDFSRTAVVPFDDKYADFYFENFNGTLYLNVRTDSDIQDMGPTGSILDIATAPSSGWSTTHDGIVEAGHTYVIWTWDDHYAKIRVSSVSSSRIVFDWAYQVRPSTPLLKHGGGERSQAVEQRVR